MREEMENWCSECRGTGRCLSCGGVRFSEIAGDRFRCGTCSGTGICHSCHGITFRSRDAATIELRDTAGFDEPSCDEHDRRGQQRFTLRLHVGVDERAVKRRQVAWTYDISRGGFLLQLLEEPAVGERIDLTIRLPNNQSVTLPCKVMHVSMHVAKMATNDDDVFTQRVKRYQVGVQFEHLSREQQDAVNTVVAMVVAK